MKFAKSLFMLALAVAIVAPMLGCSVGATAADNRRTIARIADYDVRMMVDDLALLTQTHRTLRTSRWIID